jgi:hypothetical protein
MLLLRRAEAEELATRPHALLFIHHRGPGPISSFSRTAKEVSVSVVMKQIERVSKFVRSGAQQAPLVRAVLFPEHGKAVTACFGEQDTEIASLQPGRQ